MFSIRKALVFALLLSLMTSGFLLPSSKAVSANKKFDLVVYGGTPSGVMAAIAAKRMGLDVVLISANQTVGGAISNGLSHTDIKRPEIIGGIPEEYFDAVKKASESGKSFDVNSITAEAIFNQMLAKAKVLVVRNSQVALADVVAGKITCLTTVNSGKYCGQQFIDASYEGDLLPLTKTAFNLGRKDLFEYSDYQVLKPEFRERLVLPKVLTQAEKSSLSQLPFMEHPEKFTPSQTVLTSGMPSMTYRFCLTLGKSKRALKLYAEDRKYVPAWKAIVKASYQKPCKSCHSNGNHKTTKFFTLTRVEGRKWDLNSYNSFTNFPIPKDYFTKPISRRATNKLAARYIESFVAFLQSEDNPVASERATLKGFGMCADQWADNNNVPYQPYIREGRRMVGLTTLIATQELDGNSAKDSIGLAYYNTDSKLSVSIQHENVLYRDFTDYRFTKVYHLPRGITLPKVGPKNLQVSVAVSTSPLGYGSLRMEPHYMQLGQATGITAALAVTSDRAVADIPTRSIQYQLHAWGQPVIFAFSRFIRQ